MGFLNRIKRTGRKVYNEYSAFKENAIGQWEIYKSESKRVRDEIYEVKDQVQDEANKMKDEVLK